MGYSKSVYIPLGRPFFSFQKLRFGFIKRAFMAQGLLIVAQDGERKFLCGFTGRCLPWWFPYRDEFCLLQGKLK
jgi:hypothetical protein